MNLRQGLAQLQKGDLKSAAHVFKAVLDNEPHNFDALNLLALTHIKAKEFLKAIPLLEQAKAIQPTNVQTLMNLGICLAQSNAVTEAIPLFRQIVDTQPSNAAALNALGNAYRVIGQLDDAEKCLFAAQKLAPRNPDVAENMAWLYLSQKKVEQAQSLFLSLNKVFPASMSVVQGLGESLLALGNSNDALKLYESVANKDNCSADIYNNLGLLKAKNQQTELAKEYYLKAINKKQNHAKANLNLAILLHQMGENSSTADFLLTTIAQQPELFNAYFQLAYFSQYSPSEDQIRKWALLYSELADTKDSYWLAFSLAKWYEKSGNFALAAQFYQTARQQLAKENTFDAEASAALLQGVAQLPVSQPKSINASKKRLILVTGLPRSGTTLTEQILSAHRDVLAVGESGLMAELAEQIQKMTGVAFYQGVSNLSAVQLSEISQWFTSKLERYEAGIIVDTTPANRFYLPLVYVLLPDTKVVYCVRSPLDTAISIYQYPLSGANNYANKLDTLAEHIHGCFDMHNFWIDKLNNLYPFHYEKLVANSQSNIEKLLHNVGLSLDDKCFEPQKHERSVNTPSSVAVRQAISTKSVGRWRVYEQHLPELMRLLQPLEMQYQTELADD